MANYDFRNLSSHEFEQLVRDLLQAKETTFFESFKPGKDQGIDLRYSKTKTQTTIAQCKHYVESGVRKLLQHIKTSEAPKIRKLNPTRYILATSVPLSPKNKSDLRAAIGPACKNTSDILGADDLNNILTTNQAIEHSHFKLWLLSTTVLERIIQSRQLADNELTLERIKRKFKLYVHNNAYKEACDILEREHSCIISGIPGIGKTTLAEIIISTHIAKGYELITARENIADAVGALRRGRKQIIYYDDFLGQTTLSEKLVKNEDAQLLQLMDSIRQTKGHRLVLTTREYILKQAKQSYARLADNEAELDLRKITVDLSSYTVRHRAEILINHLYFSGVGQDTLDALRRTGTHIKIVRHKNFSPRIVEIMTGQNFTNKEPASFGTEFLKNLDNPRRIWEHAFENQLSTECQELLMALRLQGGVSFLTSLREATRKFEPNGTEASFKQSLKTVEGSFTVCANDDEGIYVRFHNPSVNDAITAMLEGDRELWLRYALRVNSFTELHSLLRILDSLAAPEAKRRLVVLTSKGESIIRDAFLSPRNSTPTYVPSGDGVLRDGADQHESRLAVLLHYAEKFEQEKLLKISASLAAIVSTKLRTNPGYLTLVPLIQRLSARQGAEFDSLRGAIREYLLGNLSSLRRIDTFCDAMAANEHLFSESDIDRARAAFAEELDAQFKVNIFDYSDEDELRRDWDLAETVSTQLGVDISAYESDVEDRMQELSRPEPDDDYEREEVAVDRSSDLSDDEIDSMFGGLTRADD